MTNLTCLEASPRPLTRPKCFSTCSFLNFLAIFWRPKLSPKMGHFSPNLETVSQRHLQILADPIYLDFFLPEPRLSLEKVLHYRPDNLPNHLKFPQILRFGLKTCPMADKSSLILAILPKWQKMIKFDKNYQKMIKQPRTSRIYPQSDNSRPWLSPSTSSSFNSNAVGRKIALSDFALARARLPPSDQGHYSRKMEP